MKQESYYCPEMYAGIFPIKQNNHWDCQEVKTDTSIFTDIEIPNSNLRNNENCRKCLYALHPCENDSLVQKQN